MLRLLDNRNNDYQAKLARVVALESGVYIAKCYACRPTLQDETLTCKPAKLWPLLSKFSGKTVAELNELGEGNVQLLGRQHAGDENAPFFLLSNMQFNGDDSYPSQFYVGTNNLMGVIRIKDKDTGAAQQIEIRSRFDADDTKQYFLNYLLSQVFDVDFMDLIAAGDEHLLDILLAIIFIQKLREAVPCGLFKQYRRFDNNDLAFKGRLDLTRHFRQNYPIGDKLAYTYSAITFDNTINQLLRSTIAKIEKKWPGMISAQDDLKKYWQILQQATPSWTSQKTNNLLQCRECREPIRHPFFAEYYEDLRVISRLVLEDEGLSLYQTSDTEVAGVIFDGAWLWEAYLAKVLSSAPLSFRHHDTNVYSDGFRIFEEGSDERDVENSHMFPDLSWLEKNIILDAKYKRGKAEREDMYQAMAYMLRTGARLGGLIYPPEECVLPHARKSFANVEPKHYWQSFAFAALPDKVIDAGDYIAGMKEREVKMRKEIKQFIEQGTPG